MIDSFKTNFYITKDNINKYIEVLEDKKRTTLTSNSQKVEKEEIDEFIRRIL